MQVGEQLLQTEQQLVTQRALQRLRRLPTEQGTGYLRLELKGQTHLTEQLLGTVQAALLRGFLRLPVLLVQLPGK